MATSNGLNSCPFAQELTEPVLEYPTSESEEYANGPVGVLEPALGATVLEEATLGRQGLKGFALLLNLVRKSSPGDEAAISREETDRNVQRKIKRTKQHTARELCRF